MTYPYNHTYKRNTAHSYYSIGSGCPFPRSENNIIASAIHTPATAPYAAIPASAIFYMIHNEQ